MAEEQGKQQPSSSRVEIKRFDKDLDKDINDYHIPENEWSHARNAINNSKTGDLGKLGNEPSNLNCINLDHPIIGAIHLEADMWAIFATNDSISEIWFFKEDTCTKKLIVSDPCLNFRRTNLIVGVSRETSDCDHVIYWDDRGRNPTRALNIGDIRIAVDHIDGTPWPNVPYFCEDMLPNDPCIDCQPSYPLTLNCSKIRLAPLMESLCLTVDKDAVGGELLTGSYFAVGAYTIRGLRYTDYFPPSNIQPIFNHGGVGGSIKITVNQADSLFFDEFELVIVSIVAQQTQARKIGIYSTRQKEITLDIIDNTLPSVPVELIPVRNPVVDTTDAMYEVNDYLIRVGPKNKFDFNYQPLANQIVAKWQSVEYPQDYYKKGGNKTGYMRDEVYSFFIRFKYDTGDLTPSYHIPGRPGFLGIDKDPATGEFLMGNNGDADPEIAGNIVPYKWVVENTAFLGPSMSITLDDGGRLIREGYMGYWESTELYADNKPNIWNSNINYAPYPLTDPKDYNLCAKPIRHHRFPDSDFTEATTLYDTNNFAKTIRIMGVSFENIKRPVMNDGVTPVPGITCFEILRGSRKGNRTVIAKGMINNMVEFDIPEQVTDRKGLFQNYPYNDLRGDEFLSTLKTNWSRNCEFNYVNIDNDVAGDYDEHALDFNASHYRKDIFTFHSPETNFSNPFLSARELKVYEDITGISEHRYQFPHDHPRHTLLKDVAWILASMAGMGAGLLAANGKTTRTYINAAPNGLIYEAPAVSALLGITGITPQAFGGIPGPGNLIIGTQTGTTMEATGQGALGAGLTLLTQALNGFPTFAYYWAEGAQATWDLIKSAVTPRQHALQQFSHCLYDNSIFDGDGERIAGGKFSRGAGERRRNISTINYLDNQVQDFGTDFRVNNLYRPRTVVLDLKNSAGASRPIVPPVKVDETRWKTSVRQLSNNGSSQHDKQGWYRSPERGFKRLSSSYYAAIKQRLRNQYGQIDNITQLPIMPCPYCCLDGDVVPELVLGGQFIFGLSDWIAINWFSVPGSGTASTGGGVVTNTLYQQVPLVFIPGEQYQLSFDVLQMDPSNSLGVSLTQPSLGNQYVVSGVGNYGISFTANNLNNNVVFNEINTTPKPCPVDIVFIIDASLSVGNQVPGAPPGVTALQRERELVMNVINQMINDLPPGSDNLHVSIIGFDILGNTKIQLGANDWANINAAVQTIVTPQNFTNTASGLCFGLAEFQYRSRANSAKLMVLITDSRMGRLDIPVDDGFCQGAPGGGTAYGITGCTYNMPTASCDDPACCVADYIKSLGIPIMVIGHTSDPFGVSFNLPYWTAYASPNMIYYTTNQNTLPSMASIIVTNIFCQKIGTIIDNVSIKRITCEPEPFKTGPLFGGDTYVNRYTEKNTFFYFYNWLNGQPDNSQLDYYKYKMLPYPTYWMNSEDYDIMEGVTSLLEAFNPVNITVGMVNFIGNFGAYLAGLYDQVINGSPPPTLTVPSQWQLYNILKLPSDNYVLDLYNNTTWLEHGFALATLIPNESLLCGGPGMGIKYGYFYLFNSGVRDFFVESEYNVALRDWDDTTDKRHYDYREFTDLPELFNTDFIKAPNFYKYETSLSIAKNWFSTVKWGNVQDRDYDPAKSETCFVYKPNRLIYSLQAQFESKKDFWRIFLPNNSKDFLSKPVAIKQINKSGAVILFEADSPVMFQGTDQLQTDLGTKLTIGDGGLFSQPMQNLMNADRPYEFGSCQNARSIVNTPAGTYWISQNQGKIFELTNGIQEISLARLKWWLAQHLPYELTKAIPEFTLTDNPVVGIGCQTIYDNQNQLLYFTKRDYIPLYSGDCIQWDAVNETFVYNLTRCDGFLPKATCPEGYTFNGDTGRCEKYVDNVGSLFCPYGYTYDPVAVLCNPIDPQLPNIPIQVPCDLTECEAVPIVVGGNNAYCRCLETVDPIYVDVTVPISIHDPAYFQDVSWTISYDPKIKGWIGWHDWHPDLMIPGKNTFMSVLNQTDFSRVALLNENAIWIHNKLCDSYNQYYGVNYPFEVEYIINTGLQVNSLRSIEYQLECYRYASNCYDRFHNLDFNFDEAVIYNTEQCSGLLRLNLTPKNNPMVIMDYPATVTAGPGLGGVTDILYSKEENKYRFNQFWDTTYDRGEFPLGSVYPPPTPLLGSYAERMIWNTEPNGYVKNLNASNLDYGKNPLQRKKMRHYTTSVFLRRKAFPQGQFNPYKMLVEFMENKLLNSPR